MFTAITLPRPILAEIDSIKRAREWVAAIADIGLLFHFEDDAHSIHWSAPLTDEDKDILNRQRARLFEPDLDWGEDEDAIGYALRITGDEL